MSLVLVLLIVFFVVLGLSSLGFIDFRWPWQDIDVASQESTITYDAEEPEPKIIKIEPIALDCRARIHAEVPVKASREHQLIGQTYRTDTLEMVAIGDVDTCVSADLVDIVDRADGLVDVIIPAEAIEFSRPRVDAVATMDSVVFDKGLVGKLTDVFPWVSENNNLTPAAYAFAQTVVGGSDCMRQAYDATEQALISAYGAQMTEQGGNSTDVRVIIDGVPDFSQNDLADDPRFQDFDFAVDGSLAVCELADTAVAADGDANTET